MDALITALSRVEWLIGVTVALLFTVAILGGLALANLRWPMFISHRVHVEQVASEKSRADEARADAADDIAAARADLTTRITQIEAAYTLMLAESKRYADGWQQAYHLSDQANREESDARWDEIRAAMQVLQRFVSEIQHHRHQLEVTNRDGGGAGVR